MGVYVDVMCVYVHNLGRTYKDIDNSRSNLRNSPRLIETTCAGGHCAHTGRGGAGGPARGLLARCVRVLGLGQARARVHVVPSPALLPRLTPYIYLTGRRAFSGSLARLSGGQRVRLQHSKQQQQTFSRATFGDQRSFSGAREPAAVIRSIPRAGGVR